MFHRIPEEHAQALERRMVSAVNYLRAFPTNRERGDDDLVGMAAARLLGGFRWKLSGDNRSELVEQAAKNIDFNHGRWVKEYEDLYPNHGETLASVQSRPGLKLWPVLVEALRLVDAKNRALKEKDRSFVVKPESDLKELGLAID